MRCTVFLPVPGLLMIVPLGRLRYLSLAFAPAVFSDDLSVYRQTDDWPVVKCEVFLFRLRFCVYAE